MIRFAGRAPLVRVAALLARALLLLVVGGASAPSPFAQSVGAEAPPTTVTGAPAVPGEALAVALVTIGPGDIYWTRFGHNAILIADRAGGDARIYHFGMFDFDTEDFFLEFVRGRMMYLAIGEPYRGFGEYLDEGRSIDVQWLSLAPAQARVLREHLETHVEPANARYRYDYFVRNCSTKVRDALDLATGGALRAALASRSRGATYRWHTQRLTAPEPWLYLGTHAGLSGYADRAVTYWEEAFLPMELARRLREVELLAADGSRRPIVEREERVAEPRVAPERDGAPSWRIGFALAGLAFGALALVAARRGWRRTLLALRAGVWLVAGLGGLVLAGLWAFTEHRSAWANENLMLFDPLALALLPTLVVARWRVSRAARALAWLVAAIAVFALVAKIFPAFRQDNLDWIVFWLPIHFAIALGYAREVRAP